jgi:hypothetical protein
VTGAESRRAARALILEKHGHHCPQRPLWVELTGLLAEAEASATAAAQPLDPPATDHAKERAHG